MSDAQDTPGDITLRMRQLAGRYLHRTLDELGELRVLSARLSSGDGTALKELEVKVHRIHGSGALFGFTAMSDSAGAIEALIVQHDQASAVDLPKRIDELLGQLESEAQAAAKTEGVA